MDKYQKYHIVIEPFRFEVFFVKDHFVQRYIETDSFRHNHMHYEVHYFIDGKGIFEVNRQSFEVTPNSFFMISPGVYHVQYHDLKKPITKYCFSFNYAIAEFEEHTQNATWCVEIIKQLTSLSFRYIHEGHRLFNCIQIIKTEYQNRPFLFRQKMHIKLSELMIELIRYLSNSKDVDRLNSEAGDAGHELEIYFEEQYRNKDINAQHMADCMNVSVRHLNRMLHKHFRTSFRKKLIETRIEASKGLLVSTRLSVETIADQVGFNSVEYFYRCFKQNNLMTPTEYRNLYRFRQ